MASHLRLSEKWFNRGLWLIAFLFAYFLIGLGGTVVGDLPKIESRLTTEDFVDKTARARLTAQLKALDQDDIAASEKLEHARLQAQAAHADYQAARQAFDAWITTRNATQRADQDPDLIARTAHLERLQKKEREYLTSIEALQKQQLDTVQAKSQANRELAVLEEAARTQFEREQNRIELRVFLYRLAFVLPLLLAATWLFLKHRKRSWWPFVWGFILFSLFTFFVELVPYLPSYGGYVRYGVGVLVTFAVGKYAIAALQRYIERQRELEKQPEAQRRSDIHYDLAQSRIGKGICPGCERPTARETDNFCQHCGMEIFDQCAACGTRKIAFARFCVHCGKQTEKTPL